jgi:hypothetical protein
MSPAGSLIPLQKLTYQENPLGFFMHTNPIYAASKWISYKLQCFSQQVAAFVRQLIHVLITYI